MRTIFIIIIFSIFWNCSPSTRDEIKVNTAAENQILITMGSGGGFTGLWTGYQILTNGTVNQWQGEITDTTAFSFYANLTSEKLEQIKSVLKEPLFSDTRLNDPGNFSYVFKIPDQDEIIWNNQSKDAQPLTTLYETLTSIVEDINRADSTQIMKKW